jgi:hypothetical protein
MSSDARGAPPDLPPGTLRVVALGGIKEIGRNMTMFEYDGRLLVVDCGMLLGKTNSPGVDLTLPDWSAFASRLDRIDAVVLTHGHEDHIGALPYLLRERGDIPVIGSRLTLALVAAFVFAGVEARAQRRFTREYVAPPNIRVQLFNRSGRIEVVAWDKKSVRVTATMESPAAKMAPEVSGDGVLIDVRRDNREDVGDVNFTIRVPAGATVDISTMSGGIIIRNVHGQMVRAHVSTEGDIELTGIRAQTVMAENTVGNILFDAELLRGGTYVLNSTQGDIQLRITAEAGFRLMAVAPRTRNIELNGFAQMGEFEYFNDKRKVVGKVGDGGAALSTTNGRGSIVFMPR